MPEVLLSNDDVTVLGPPSTIELLLDIGPQGTRGSQTFIGVGNPNTVDIGQTPELNDLYINTSPGPDYGYLYQYVAEPGGDTWIEVLQMNPTIFSKNYSVVFTSGSGSITIPVSDITSVAALVAENFSVQYSIAHSNPVASSMSIPALAGAGDDLVIDLEAAEYASSTWSDLDEEVTVHVFITIVDAGES
jgi:hypothetical protein